MKIPISPAPFAIMLALVAGVALRAQNTPVPPDVKAFAAQYVTAYNSGDMARLLTMYLPESRACITPANKDVYDAIASLNGHDHVPPGYLLSFMPVNQGNLNALAANIHFAVKPERELHIDYQYPNTNDGGQLVLWLVRRNGGWISDFPCMTAQAIQDFRDSAPDRLRYKNMAAAIKEPLRSQLIAMLRQHQSGEAAERYQKAIGSDMRTAMLVVAALQDQLQ
jgi:hypothetical protein